MKENKNRKELQISLAERPASLWTLPVAPVRGTAVGRFERMGLRLLPGGKAGNGSGLCFRRWGRYFGWEDNYLIKNLLHFI